MKTFRHIFALLALMLTATLSAQVIEFHENYNGEKFVYKEYLANYDSIRYVPAQDWSANIVVDHVYTDEKGQGHAVFSATTGPDAHEALVAMGEDLSPEYFMDGGGQYISVPAGTTTQVDFVVPDITKTYRVILFCRNRYYPSQYYYWYNYVSPNLWWRSIGMGTYTEDIICSLFGVEDVTYEVEVEENMTTPGLFRLKNPYGAAFPYNEPGDWDASRDYYLEIHAEDPTAVYIEEQELGLDWNYGMFRIISYAAYYMQVGYDKEIIKANDFFGTLTDGVITFPKANSFLVAMPSIQDGDWSYSGNRNGGFRLVLPAEPDYPTASKRMPRNLPPTNKQGINYRLVPIDDRME